MDEPKFVLKKGHLCLHEFSLQSSILTWTQNRTPPVEILLFYCQRLLLGSQKNNIFRKLKLVEEIVISPPCATWQDFCTSSRDDSKSSAKETGVPLTNSWVTPLCASPKSVGGADGSTTKETGSLRYEYIPVIDSRDTRIISSSSKKENQIQHPLLDILDAISLSVNILKDRHVQKVSRNFPTSPLAFHPFTTVPFMSHRGT